MSEKKVTVRLVMEGGKVVEAELQGLGAKGKAALGGISTASNQVSKDSRNMGFQVQNAAFQVQDFFVQVAGGTSASRAFGQQLPQLLGSMGLFGVLAGTAAAALIPLIGYLFKGEDQAAALKRTLDELSTSVGALDQAISRLKQINDVYSTEGIQRLIDKYGELDGKILMLIEHQRQFAVDKAMADARVVQSDVAEAFSGLIDLVRQYDLAANSANSSVGLMQAAALVDELQESYGLTVGQAKDLVGTLDQLKGASGPSEAADAAARLNGYLEQSTLKGTELQGRVIDVEDAMRQLNKEGSGIQGWLGAAISGAAEFAAHWWDAAAAVRAASQPVDTMGGWQAANHRLAVEKGPGVAVLPGALTPGGVRPKPAPIGIDGWIEDAPTRGGGGGGNSARNDALREAERLFEETRTAAEKYAAEEIKISALLKSGAIDADTYQRAIEMIGKKYGEAGDAGKFFAQIDTELKSAFLDLATTGENSFKRIADAIKRAAFEALLFGEGPLAGIFGGKAGGKGLLGGLLGTLLGGLGGKRANGGPVAAGMTYLVGEKGPELFQPGSAGSIIPNKALRGAGGGAMTINVNVSGARGNTEIQQMVSSGVQQGIAAYDKHALPTRVKQISDDPRRRG